MRRSIKSSIFVDHRTKIERHTAPLLEASYSLPRCRRSLFSGNSLPTMDITVRRDCQSRNEIERFVQPVNKWERAEATSRTQIRSAASLNHRHLNRELSVS